MQRGASRVIILVVLLSACAFGSYHLYRYRASEMTYEQALYLAQNSDDCTTRQAAITILQRCSETASTVLRNLDEHRPGCQCGAYARVAMQNIRNAANR